MPLLLTPGPLTTSQRTRDALRDDWGSRDPAFVAQTAELRRRLVDLCADPAEFVAVPMQGSGTFAVEATLGTLVGSKGKLLVLVNGAYGKRMVAIAQRQGRAVDSLSWLEHEPVDPGKLDAALAADPSITHVAVVHCETTTGLLNDVAAVCEVCGEHGAALIVDSMSAFGALRLHADDVPFDALVASSNKCLEGAPGFGYAVVRRTVLVECEGRAPSLSLDLHEQWLRFEKDEQWRFTPPVQVVVSFVEALRQHELEGGVAGRGARYARNRAALVHGLRGLGFRTLLPDERQAPIIVTFHEPVDAAWSFTAVYDALVDEGFAIYPGKLTDAPTFRVGCIGQVFEDDLRRFVQAMGTVMGDLGVRSGAPAEGVGF